MKLYVANDLNVEKKQIEISNKKNLERIDFIKYFLIVSEFINFFD